MPRSAHPQGPTLPGTLALRGHDPKAPGSEGKPLEQQWLGLAMGTASSCLAGSPEAVPGSQYVPPLPVKPTGADRLQLHMATHSIPPHVEKPSPPFLAERNDPVPCPGPHPTPSPAWVPTAPRLLPGCF